MIAPVTFAALPRELVGPVNDVTGLLPEDGAPYNLDQWDGYTADRRQVLRHLDDHGVKDALFVTGDIHSGWACELPLDTSTYLYENPARKSVGVELVCSSVTSNNLKDITGDPTGQTSTGVEEAIKANNRHIRYLNFDDHGYSVLDVNRRRAQMDWFVIRERADRATGVRWDGSWRTRSGTGRIEPVDRPLSQA
jgi:alkaline phosphatase D